MLVKLQRPPPDIRIFLPALLERSITSTWRPRAAAVRAHIRPAAPAPMITTSAERTAGSSSTTTLARGCSRGTFNGLLDCERLLDVFAQRLRRVLRPEAFDDLAVAADQELREVPLDRLAAQEAGLLALE